MNFRVTGVVAAVLLLAGCSRPLEQKSLTEVKDTPDIVAKAAAPGSHWRAFNLRAFQVGQIWGGDGHGPKGDKWANYRAKITLWDNDPEKANVALAEIYFRDTGQLVTPELFVNPDPNDPKDPNNQNAQGQGPGRTYRLNFPMNTLDGVIQTLRFANSDVFLYYYDDQWAIGTDAGELIGSN
jgi:hypothetical protein